MTASSPVMTRVTCRLDVPPSFRPGAWYALRMLLEPLGLALEPANEHSGEGDIALRYGGKVTETGRTLVLPCSERTFSFFERKEALTEKNVRWIDWDGERWPAFGWGGGSADLVASTFFWLSGWQEFTIRERDRHGRFPFHVSWQDRLGTAGRPLVDVYREMLAARLTDAGIPIHRRSWAGQTWAFCPTHDIDYIRKWRPGLLYREIVPYFLKNERRVSFGRRLRRLGGVIRDVLRPDDVFRQALDRIAAEETQRGAGATFFFKTGATDEHDTFYSPVHPYVRSRLAALESDGFEIGLHPSYQAHTHTGHLQREKTRLQKRTSSPVLSVRQHYLRYDPLITTRIHQEAGFQIDSTLGFSEHEGFRHATCLPFQLFDLYHNRPYDVWEIPLTVMESMMFNRRGRSLDQAVHLTVELMETCRRFGGVFVGLWHNTLWDEMDYPGWGDHFLKTLDAAIERDAAVLSLRDALESWKPSGNR